MAKTTSSPKRRRRLWQANDAILLGLGSRLPNGDMRRHVRDPEVSWSESVCSLSRMNVEVRRL